MEELIAKLRRFRDDRDWGQFHTPKDLAISVNVESGELLELFQWRPEAQAPDADLVEKLRNEAADVILYLLLLCDAVGIDLEAAAHEKIRVNEARFPISTSRGLAKPKDMTGEE